MFKYYYLITFTLSTFIVLSGCTKPRTATLYYDFERSADIKIEVDQNTINKNTIKADTIILNIEIKNELINTNKLDNTQIDSTKIMQAEIVISNNNNLDMTKLDNLSFDFAVLKDDQTYSTFTTLLQIRNIKNNTTKTSILNIIPQAPANNPLLYTNNVKIAISGKSLVNFSGIFDAKLNMIIRVYAKPFQKI